MGLGAGVRTNPVAGSDDIPLIVLPSISYYGERFYFENLNFGYQLIEADSYDFNLILTPGRDHLFFNRWSLGNFSVDGSEARASSAFSAQISTAESDLSSDGENDITLDGITLSSRSLSILGGVDLHYYYESLSLGLQVLYDLRGVHSGYESRAALSYSKELGKNALSAAAGFIWQDRKTIDYYYGLEEQEVPFDNLIYGAGSGLSPFVRFDWLRSLNDRWSLKATIYYRDLASAIENSPIVDESGVATLFFGGVYHF